jgi:transcriptional regulator with XRE-family HTH domain
MSEITPEDHGPVEEGPLTQTLIDNKGRTEPAIRSVNQVVAWNMKRLRELRSWSQQDLAEKLAEIKTEKWTSATVGAAERSWSTERVRRFDANDLAALAHVFKVTLVELLTPPDESEIPRRYVASETVKGGGTPGTDEWMNVGLSGEELVAELFGETPPSPEKPGPPAQWTRSKAKHLVTEALEERLARASLEELIKVRIELDRPPTTFEILQANRGLFGF